MKRFLFILLALVGLLTLTACGNKDVTVSFVSNGGPSVEDIVVTQESTITEPSIEREGYTFNGWFEDEALTTAFDFNTVIVRNMTLYASWTINSYTLTFVFDNGTENYVTTENYNTTITFPTSPTKTGYTFGGWYSDAEMTVSFDATRFPGETLTIYAKWIPNEFTVSFYESETSTTPYETRTVYYGDAVSNIPALEVRTGYNAAWSEDLTNITSDLDVYPVYTKKVFTVSFQDELGNVYNTQSIEYGDSITPASTPSKNGYTFLGYHTATSETIVNLATYTVTANVTLIDTYSIIYYTVSFYGGEEMALLETYNNLTYGEAATAPTAPERVGYTFTGWSVDFSNVTSDLVVNAVYQINSYTVTFDANGGVYTDLSTSKDVTVNYNTNVAPSETPTRDNYFFAGWYSDASLSDEYRVNFGIGIPMSAANYTVYAKWEVRTLNTVSGTAYYLEEGIATDELSTTGIFTEIGSEAYTPFANIVTGTEMLPIYDIEGYEFYKYTYNGVDYYDQSALVTINGDTTIDVYYVRTILTVTFLEYINEALEATTYYVLYNGTLQNVPTPTAITGMTVEWERGNFENIKTNLTVSAISYDNSLQNVIFKSNDSTIYIATNEDSDPNGVVITAESALWNIQESGYHFVGWYEEGDLTETIIPQGTILYSDFATNHTVLIAKWVELTGLATPSEPTIVLDTTAKTVTVTFTADSVTVGEVTFDPSDFEFILNNSYISSDLVSGDALINYMTNVGNEYTMTLTETNPYYTFFESILVSDDTLIPGTHLLQVIAKGDNINTKDSEPSNSYQYVVKSIYDGIPESTEVKDYYIIENYGSDSLLYIFYTNLSYEFTGKTFEILSGFDYISANGNVLTTSNFSGEFTFSITDTNGTRTYHGLVVKDIRQFNIGSSYQTYLDEVSATIPEDVTDFYGFLKDSSATPYYVGASNEFHLDILIRNNNGEKISLDDVYLTYTFYLDGSATAITENDLAQYLTLTGNEIDFTANAVDHTFTIVVEPKYESTKMDMAAIQYTVYVNDGYNAYDNDDLKTLFSDLDVSLINVQRDITAELYSNQVHEDDGSPVNIYATPTNDYENIGNVYYRIDGATNNDDIMIQGNFMTVDASNVEYITYHEGDFGTVGFAEAFEVMSVQVAIFYYNVTGSDAIVNDNVFNMSNLRVLGNTTTPSINYAADPEEILTEEHLMSQNSGGLAGITVRDGIANLDNVIVGYSTIGITSNSYGENSSGDALIFNLDYVSVYDSWANSIYLWKGAGFNITNSSFASSGGASIHFEDVASGTSGYNNPVLILGENVVFNNWISGQEAWFKAYAMTQVALQLKSSINTSIADLGKTVIQTKVNPVNGELTEMINLIFLSRPQDSAVTYSDPNNQTTVITASEVDFSITDADGSVYDVYRDWNFLTEEWPISATVSIVDPRISGGQFGFAYGSLSDTYAFLQMISDIQTVYTAATGGGTMSDTDAGNLATVAGFYNLTATEAVTVAGAMQQGYTLHQAIIAVKGSLDYTQPEYIEIIAPLPIPGSESGNAVILIQMFNSAD